MSSSNSLHIIYCNTNRRNFSYKRFIRETKKKMQENSIKEHINIATGAVGLITTGSQTEQIFIGRELLPKNSSQ